MNNIDAFESETHESIVALGLQSLDIALGQFVYQQSVPKNNTIALFAGLLSQRLRQQDSCLDLNDLSPTELSILGVRSLSELKQILSESNCVAISPTEQQEQLIVLENNQGYLRRYYDYEVALSQVIKQRLQQRIKVDQTKLKQLLWQLFPEQISAENEAQSAPEIDWQKIAVCVAANQTFSVITGGPGTGKTTTVAKLLAVLDGLEAEKNRSLNVKLVAPTGKAAARLSESLARAKQALPETFQHVLNAQSSTIHRLLGVKFRSNDFKHNAQNPLHLDVLIVDEASMVDLPLMCKLLVALPKRARVILLGDHNQLSSVETGSVLYDLCQSANSANAPHYSDRMTSILTHACDLDILQATNEQLSKSIALHPMQDALVTLQKSHRFSDTSEIGQLSKAVISGNLDKSLSLMESGQSVRWHQQSSVSALVQKYVTGLGDYFSFIKQNDIAKAFLQLEKQQILCAFKSGEWGVENINKNVEKELVKQGLIEWDELNYPGHPIMLSSNEHNLGLFNGDIGIVMPDPDNHQLKKAWFKDGQGGFRGVLLSRLPPHSTVFAMTIHKSQGSEFQSIHMCLPDFTSNQSGATLSRELFYTGLTRARSEFHLYGNKQVLSTCLQAHCRRSSGLTQRLSQP